jgi:hypothetical protein
MTSARRSCGAEHLSTPIHRGCSTAQLAPRAEHAQLVLSCSAGVASAVGVQQLDALDHPFTLGANRQGSPATTPDCPDAMCGVLRNLIARPWQSSREMVTGSQGCSAGLLEGVKQAPDSHAQLARRRRLRSPPIWRHRILYPVVRSRELSASICVLTRHADSPATEMPPHE